MYLWNLGPDLADQRQGSGSSNQSDHARLLLYSVVNGLPCGVCAASGVGAEFQEAASAL